MDYKNVIGQNVILKSGAIGKITDVTDYLNVQVDEEVSFHKSFKKHRMC